VKTGEDDLVGACDCDGFRFHLHPRAHLAAIAQLDALQSIIPVDRQRAEKLAFSVDAEVIDQTAQTETAAWLEFIRRNQRVVLTNVVDTKTWRDAAAAIAEAAMGLDEDILLLIDEAHKVAPQQGGYPDAIETLATEGRGRLASVWVTQRLAKPARRRSAR